MKFAEYGRVFLDNHEGDDEVAKSYESEEEKGNDRSSSLTGKVGEVEGVVKEKRKRKNKPRNKSNKGWIYITGLPGDITIEEIKSHFSKAIDIER